MRSTLGLDPGQWAQHEPYLGLYWGGRPQSAASVAAAVAQTLSSLDTAGVVARSWTYASSVDELLTPVPTEEDALTRVVAASTIRDEDGTPEPGSGYSPLLRSHDPVTTRVDVHAGQGTGSSHRPINRVLVNWPPTNQSTPTIQTTSTTVARTGGSLVQTLASIWSPDIATLTSLAIIEALGQTVPNAWPVLGAITWLPGHLYTIPDHVPGATVNRAGPDTFLTIGTPEHPCLDVVEVMTVYTYLAQRNHLHPAPANQTPRA